MLKDVRRAEGHNTQEPESPDSEPDLIATAGQLLQAVRSAIDQTFRLVAQEARLAAVSLAGIIVLGVFVGVAVVAAWLLVAGAGVVWTVQAGLGWVPALLFCAIFNIGLAVVAWFGIRWLSRNLLFRASRRCVTGEEGGKTRDTDNQTEA